MKSSDREAVTASFCGGCDIRVEPDLCPLPTIGQRTCSRFEHRDDPLALFEIGQHGAVVNQGICEMMQFAAQGIARIAARVELLGDVRRTRGASVEAL